MNSSSSRALPVSKLMHLYFSIPLKRLTPPVAKIRRKNMSTITVFWSSGRAFNTALTIILRPSMLVIALRGLSTLNARRDEIDKPSSYAELDSALLSSGKK